MYKKSAYIFNVYFTFEKLKAILFPTYFPPKIILPRVRVFGPGVERTGVVAGSATHFTVDTSRAGKGRVEATLTHPDFSTTQVGVTGMLFHHVCQ